jgi:hypothetical protein
MRSGTGRISRPVNRRRSGIRLARWCWWALARGHPAAEPGHSRGGAGGGVAQGAAGGHAFALVQTNRAFHRMLRDGVPVEYPRPDGSIAGDHVRLVDFGDVRANDWLAVNQFTVIEGQHNRRPDIVVFVNGLPLA